MLRLWIKDKCTGKVHEYGTNPHDALILDASGSIYYYNLQNGEASGDYGSYEFCAESGDDLGRLDGIVYVHIADNPPPQPDPQKEFDEAREETEISDELKNALEKAKNKALEKIADKILQDGLAKMAELYPCYQGETEAQQKSTGRGGCGGSCSKNALKETIKEACDEYAATAWEKMTEPDPDENLDEAPKFHKIPFSPEDKKMLLKKFFRDLGMEAYDDKQPKPNQYPYFTFTLEPENEKRFGAICNELIKIYTQKNHDYGDSFHQSYVEEGLAMARIRLGDKFNRFKTLTKNQDGQQVNDESIKDTLKDMACYAIMTLMELERETEVKSDDA